MRWMRKEALWFGIWLSACAVGLSILARHASTPGPPAPRDLIASLAPAKTVGRPLLIVHIHPQCPCTRAAVRNLRKALASPGQPIDVEIVLWPGQPEDPQTKTMELLAELPLARLRFDRWGEASRARGAKTSGHAYLHDANGALLFQGGLTPLRGHEGPCLGIAAIEAVRRGETPAATEAPVFGCPLFDE